MKRPKQAPVISEGIAPESTKRREELLARSRSTDLLSSVVMLAVGLVMIVASSVPSALNFFNDYEAVFAVPLMVALLLILYRVATVARYDLSPKDEYEQLQLLKAKTAAFNTLSGLLILIVLSHHYIEQYVENLSVIGLVLVALGYARFVEWKNSEL